MGVGLQYVIVVFPGHNTFFRFRSSAILIVIDELYLFIGDVIRSVNLYADDSTLYDIGLDKDILENNLQHALNFLKNWCLENGMIINIDKTKIVSEYDQEIPQSQTADKPMAPGGRATQQSRATRKTN